MSVLPYQFEPEKKKNENGSDDEWEDVDSEIVEETKEGDFEENLRTMNRTEVDVNAWCKCGECIRMPVNRECLCCHEIDDIKFKKLSDDVTCIIKHEGFAPTCINRWVLWAALVSLHDRECARLPPADNVPNRSYRYAGYRQFSYFIYTKLGRYVRRIIPACAVSKIRREYPEESGRYVNFEGDDEGADAISEVVQAWEY